MLAGDVADIDPDLLGRAISHHVRSSPYMPKASDLRAIADNMTRQASVAGNAIARGNANLREIGRGDELEWQRDSQGHYRLREIRKPGPPAHLNVMDRRGQPMSHAETKTLNAQLEHLGATARYREDGSRYLVERAA